MTLLFTAGILALMAGGALFAMRRSLPSKVDGLLPWGYAMLIGGLSSLLRWQQGALPDFVSLVVAEVLYVISVVLVLYGLRRFNGQPTRMTFVAALSIAELALTTWFSLADAEFYLRIVVTSGYDLVMCPLLIGAALSDGGVRRSPARQLIAAMFSGMFVVMLVQLLVALRMGPALKGFDSTSDSNLLLVGSFNVFIIGLLFGLVMLVNDRLRADLANLANTDPLTAILNRRAFMDEAGRVLARERRHQHPSTLLMLDLDHFKLVNDRYGHLQGDHVLKQFAARISQRLRGGDLFARYGGEEFLVLLPGADAAAARTLAEKLRLRISDTPFELESSKTALTVSIGLAVDTGQGGVSDLIEAADAALYRAKNNGRDRIEIADPHS